MAFWPSGTKRILSVLASSRPLLPVRPVTVFQVVPPSVEYCQLPLPLLVALMAMPWTAPVSTSPTVLPRKLATVWPALAVSSSVSGLRVGASALSTGASFTAETATLMPFCWAEKAVVPPLAVVSA